MNRFRAAGPSRRGLLAAAGGLTGAAALSPRAGAVEARPELPDVEPFFGPHQSGIVTLPQAHTYFAALDLTAKRRADVVGLLRSWTEAAARMTAGQPARKLEADPDKPALDSGEALGLSASRLSITFGFGAGLFVRDGADRYGLAAQRPEALVDLPRFNGDQLVPAATGGDLSVQACADDPQVAFHAVRQLVAMAYGGAALRWTQTGFTRRTQQGDDTPRNLMGFKDGTQRPANLGDVVWVGAEGPGWMRGGSYMVARRIRVALEHWDRTELGFQEEVVGRRKYSGAPIGGKHEFDALDLEATDQDGNPVIPENAHVRLGNAASAGGALIHRRGYSYNDGVSVTAERWPPWRQGLQYDAGLFFIAYQRDPRTGFIRIFENMAKFDAMNQYVTHVGGGLFACPAGVADGGYIGQGLFEA